MSRELITQALGDSAKDDGLVREFLAIWPDIESILQAFSKATSLPTFAYFNDIHVFQSSLDTMPAFCSTMLGSEETRKLCMGDSQQRVAGQVPVTKAGAQMCHAGMLNERRQVESGVGRHLLNNYDYVILQSPDGYRGVQSRYQDVARSSWAMLIERNRKTAVAFMSC